MSGSVNGVGEKGLSSLLIAMREMAQGSKTNSASQLSSADSEAKKASSTLSSVPSHSSSKIDFKA